MPDRVSEVMTDKLVTVEPTSTIAEAAAKMRDYDIGDVLVVQDDTLFGIVTDRDLVVRALADGAATSDAVGPYASRDVYTVGPDDSVAELARTMADQAVRRVPVVDGNNCPVGIVSLGDLAEDRAPDTVLGDISEARPNN